MIVYDIETLRGPDEVEGGWPNPAGMGFGCAVAYFSTEDRYRFYVGDEGKASLIAALTQGREPVVSFNGIRFDNRVLLGKDRQGSPWFDDDLLLWVVQRKFGCDSVSEAQYRHGSSVVYDGSIGLDGMSEGTLGLRKTGSGAHAPELIKAGKWAEVFDYCLNDVRLTRKLYEFRRAHSYLVDRKGTVIR